MIIQNFIGTLEFFDGSRSKHNILCLKKSLSLVSKSVLKAPISYDMMKIDYQSQRDGMGMNEKFFDLKKEKQDRMINASLKMFAENGYKRASTDDIVREAGISKGLLFHYFGSKAGLYEFLVDYSSRYTMLETAAMVSSKEKDYFVIYQQLLGIRTQIMRNYPYMQYFLERAMKEDSEELSQEVREKIRAYRDYEDAFFRKAQLSLFNDRSDFEMVHNMLKLTIQGIMVEIFTDGTFDPDRFYDGAVTYLNMMRALCYT